MKLRIFSALLRKELLLMRRTVYIPLIIVIFPIAVMMAIPRVANMDVKNVSVAVTDNDHSQLSRRVIANLDASEWISVNTFPATSGKAISEIEHGRVDVVLTIPYGFSRDMSDVEIEANGVNATKAMLGAQYVAQSVMQTVRQEGKEASEGVSIVNRHNPTLDFRNYMIPAIMVVLIIIICGFLPTLNIVSEKESGTIEAMNVTPVGRFAFVFSKLLPYWIAGMIVVTIGVVTARLVYGLAPSGSIGLIYLAAILFTLVMSGLGVIIANKSETLLQSIFVMFAVIIIFQLMGGLFTPISSMPQWAQNITYAVPPRYFNEIMRSVYLKGSTLRDLMPQFLSLTAFAAGLCLIATATYKKQS